MLSNHSNETTIIYHSKDPIGKEVLAYVQTSSFQVKDIDISKQNLTGTLYEELASKLGISSLKELVNEQASAYEKIKNMEFDSDNDYIKIFQHTPTLLKTPILIHVDNAEVVKSSGDVMKYLDKQTV